MKIVKYCLLVFAVISCSEFSGEDAIIESNNAELTRSAKILGTPAENVVSSFLVKVDNSDALESLSEIEGVKSLEPVFNMAAGDVDLKKEMGLDRWYEVALDEGAELCAAVEAAAAIRQVEKAQYETVATKAVTGDPVPYEGVTDGPAPATRGSKIAFNDPMKSQQWNMENLGDGSIFQDAYVGGDIDVVDVWSRITCGDPSIIVAVIDEGIKPTHPDLRANMWVNSDEIAGNGLDDDGNGYIDDIYGYNFVNNGELSWTDKNDYGHACHCGGVIAAVNNNGIGICGVAGGSGKGDGVRLMSCQIFSGNSGGTSRMTAKAFEYAADNGASVASCSFGYGAGVFTSDSAYAARQTLEYEALRYFERKANNKMVDGNIAIFSAGNDGTAFSNYPGAISDQISVSAFNPAFLPARSYTNYDKGCNIVAPGGEYKGSNAKGAVLSAVPENIASSGYAYMQGTSMACPHVSGIAALALSYAKALGKTFTLDEFKTILVTSANEFDSRVNTMGKSDNSYMKYYKKMGTGAIDTWQVMMQVEGIPSICVPVGAQNPVDMSSYFGTASANLTYLGVEISQADKAALGLESNPYIKYGKLFVKPTKMGSAKIKVRAIAGGTNLGGTSDVGGMEVSHEISIIARNVNSSNGGWL